MENRLRLFLTLFFLPSALFAQETIDRKFEMKEYYLVFLKKGPNRGQDSAAAAQIMKGHLEHLTKLYEEDKVSVCGPLLDDCDIRGICIYHLSDSTLVRQLAEADPAVRSGRLTVEIDPWYSAKGMVLK